jgi:hypothetical protein
MANLSAIPLRKYGSSDTHWNYERANEPLEDLFRMIRLVNGDLEAYAKDFEAAKGSAPTLAARLAVAFEADGTLKSGAITSFPIASVVEQNTIPYNGMDKIHFTRAERAKLSLMGDRSNRFVMKIDNSEPLEGEVTLRVGRMLKASAIRDSSGETTVRLDTRFSADVLHEHRYAIKVLNYLNGIAFIPDNEDAPIPGTILLYVNGQRVRRSGYEEYFDRNGVLKGVRIIEQANVINLQTDDIELDYLTRTRPLDGSSVDDTISLLLDHDLVAEDLRQVKLPDGSMVQSSFYYWLIDISDVKIDDLTQARLFVSEFAFTVGAAVKGMTLRRYGQEWDVVNMGGRRFIRWRYQDGSAISTNPAIEDKYANWLFLTQGGSGTDEAPNTRQAVANLGVGFRLSLFT